MYMNVKFKNRKKEFVGKTYSYELLKDEEVPKAKSIVRLMDKDYDYIANGTRVRVESVSEVPLGKVASYLQVRYAESSLDD